MEEGKACFDNVAVATFGNAILLGSMWRCSVVGDSHGLEQRDEGLVFATIVGEHGYNGGVKEFFNQEFELWKKFGDIRFVFNGIKPNVF